MESMSLACGEFGFCRTTLPRWRLQSSCLQFRVESVPIRENGAIGVEPTDRVPVRAAALAVASARPTLDDVERLSRGRPSKAKIGSRAVPHRLNAEERKAFELAKKRGFVVQQANTRRYPLINSHRNFCDALGLPCIRIVQGSADCADEVVVDLTPLRLTEIDFEMLSKQVIEAVASIPNFYDEATSASAELPLDYSVEKKSQERPAQVETGDEESTIDHGASTRSQGSLAPDFTSETTELLRFQATSRNLAKLIAQTSLDAWKTWKKSSPVTSAPQLSQNPTHSGLLDLSRAP